MRTLILILLAATMLVASGCGDAEEVGPSPVSDSRAELQEPPQPRARESIDAAERRVAEIVSSGDCDRVYTLSPLSRQPGFNTPELCTAFRGLAEFDAVRAAAYGGGGVIDYEAEDASGTERIANGIFMVDADGLYHLLAVENTSSVGTPFAAEFDDAAKESVEAIRNKDCQRFLRISVQRQPEEAEIGEICSGQFAENPFAELLGAYPRLKPERLGGNGRYAFYRVATPEASFTMLLARNPDPTERPTNDFAPAEFGFVDAVRTGSGSISLPKATESIASLEERVGRTVASSDCEDVYTLNPLSRRPGFDVPRQCAGFQTLAEMSPTRSARYRGGAVIDFVSGTGAIQSGVFILDADGLYHLALVDPVRTEPSVGTNFDPEFDAAAEDAMSALRREDCDDFLKTAVRQYGPGAASPAEICAYVSTNPLATLLAEYPEAIPRRLGGNGSFAFYAIASPSAHFTVVLARESLDESPPGGTPLPAEAPEYGYLDAFLTNTRFSPDTP